MARVLRYGFTDDDLWLVGSTRRFKIVITDSAGAIKDITGASRVDFVLSDITGAEGTPTPVIPAKSLGSGVAITDGPNGEITVTVTPADSQAIKPDDYPFEVKATDILNDTEAGTAFGYMRLSPSLFSS